MLLRVVGIVLVTVMAVIPMQNAYAIHAMESAITEAGQDSALTIKGQLGVLNGEARELVYGGAASPGYEDYKVSELVWDLEGVVMAGVVVSLGGGGPLVFNMGLWKGLNEGSGGGMVDYDWMDPSTPDWTDRSFSDVDVIDATMFDINLSFTFFERENMSLAVVGGLKYDTWEWDDQGQEYTYSVNGFRDTTGSFGGQNVIDYKQMFIVPYIGLEGAADFGAISVQGYVLYSSLTVAEDEDHHILRGLHFKETFDGGDYLAFGVSCSFDINETLFVQIALEHQKVDEIIGDMEIVETAQNIEDGAGISHEATMMSASVGIRL